MFVQLTVHDETQDQSSNHLCDTKEDLGDCGILVPVRDSKALSKALQVAVHLPRNEAALLGLRARQRVVDNYSLEHVVERWLEIYKS